jgi:hypothetical protein
VTQIIVQAIIDIGRPRIEDPEQSRNLHWKELRYLTSASEHAPLSREQVRARQGELHEGASHAVPACPFSITRSRSASYSAGVPQEW